MFLEVMIAAGLGFVVAGVIGKVLLSREDQRKLDDVFTRRREVGVDEYDELGEGERSDQPDGGE